VGKTVNRVTLLGNVGKAPEVRATSGGNTVANFSIATVNRFKDGRGEWKDQTEWHNCVAFGKTAEIIGKYVGKGAKLFIEGRLQTRSWEDKESGQTKYRTEIVIADISLLGAPSGKQATSDDGSEPGYAYTRDAIVDESDIPF
jgi:single-strand DNA-binding protein